MVSSIITLHFQGYLLQKILILLQATVPGCEAGDTDDADDGCVGADDRRQPAEGLVGDVQLHQEGAADERELQPDEQGASPRRRGHCQAHGTKVCIKGNTIVNYDYSVVISIYVTNRVETSYPARVLKYDSSIVAS